MESRKFKWFVWLEVGISIFCILLGIYTYIAKDITDINLYQDLFSFWSEFTWYNVGLYFGSNIIPKFSKFTGVDGSKQSDVQHPDLLKKKQSRKYKTFVYLQSGSSLLALGYLIVDFVLYDAMSWEGVLEHLNSWATFTWMNVGFYFTANTVTKFTKDQD